MTNGSARQRLYCRRRMVNMASRPGGSIRTQSLRYPVFDMLPSDDMKSCAFRLVHFGIIARLIGMAILVLLLLQNTYLIFSVRALRTQIRGLESKIRRLDSRLAQVPEQH